MKKGKYAQAQKSGGTLYVLLILLFLIAAAEGIILLLPRLRAAEIAPPGSAQHQKAGEEKMTNILIKTGYP